MIVLDTNVLSELMRRRPDPAVVAWVDGQDAGRLAITAITAAELRYGVARLSSGVRKARLESAVRALLNVDFSGRVLRFDGAAADLYGDLVAECDRAGRPIGAADAQIAAICRCQVARLATRNVRDFEATGVDVLDPWTAG